MSTRGTNPIRNVPNPYSTTSVPKGQGRKKRKTRKSKKSKRKTRKHRKWKNKQTWQSTCYESLTIPDTRYCQAVSPTLSSQSPSHFHLLLKIMHTRFNAVCPVIKVASIQIHKAFICLRSYLNRQALDLEHCTSPDIIFFNKNNSVFNEKFEFFRLFLNFTLLCFVFWKFALLCFVFGFSAYQNPFWSAHATSSSLVCRAQNSSLNCSGQLAHGRIRYCGILSRVLSSILLACGCFITARLLRPPFSASVVQSSNWCPQQLHASQPYLAMFAASRRVFIVSSYVPHIFFDFSELDLVTPHRSYVTSMRGSEGTCLR